MGSGSIVDNNAYVPSNCKIPSNSFLSGNPVKIIQDEVFFTKDYLGGFNESSSEKVNNYASDVFIYEVVPEESLYFPKIDEILKSLNVDDSLEFIQKLFVHNNRKNRFAIR